MIERKVARHTYEILLEILAAAWEAGLHGGDTSTLDRTMRLL